MRIFLIFLLVLIPLSVLAVNNSCYEPYKRIDTSTQTCCADAKVQKLVQPENTDNLNCFSSTGSCDARCVPLNQGVTYFNSFYVMLGLILFFIFLVMAIIQDVMVFNDASNIYNKKNGRKLYYFSIRDRFYLAFQIVGWKALLNKEFLEEKLSKATVIICRLTLVIFVVMILLFLLSGAQ